MQENKAISFPLLFAKENEILCITELRGGKHFKDRCINQGIIPGQKVEVLNASKRGPYVIAINDSRVIMGNGMLGKIFVQTK